jgi:hypothetical protein
MSNDRMTNDRMSKEQGATSANAAAAGMINDWGLACAATPARKSAQARRVGIQTKRNRNM